MKKDIFKWLSIFVMAAVCVGFASCGDDDEEGITPAGEGKSDTSKQPTPLVFGTKHLKKIEFLNGSDERTYYTFSYNAEGMDVIVDNYNNYTLQFTEHQKKLKASGKHPYTAVLSYNNMGYVSTMHSALSGTYDADADCPDLNFKYDAMGRLLEVYEKRHQSDSSDYLWGFTWVNDTITTITRTTLSTGRVSYTEHFTYGGGKYPNNYRQYTFGLAPTSGHLGRIGSLFYVGYVGKGSAYFPTRHDYVDGIDYVYAISDDGTVKTQTRKGGYYTLNYIYE